MSDENKKAYIAALLAERAHYERYGRDDRVADVDAELAKVGHKAKVPAQRATRMTRPKADSEL